MLNWFLSLLPTNPDLRLILAAWCGVVVGVVLWLSGARFSRYLLTLTIVAIAAWAGLWVPRNQGWDVNPIATSMGAGLVGGVIAYAGHRFLIAIGMGSILATAAAVIAGRATGTPALPLPSREELSAPTSYIVSVWEALPEGFRTLGSTAMMVAFFAGWTFAGMCPRAGAVSLYVTSGLAMAIVMAAAAIFMKTPHWLEMIPAQPALQGALVGVLMIIGYVVQWRLLPKKKEAVLIEPERKP